MESWSLVLFMYNKEYYPLAKMPGCECVFFLGSPVINASIILSLEEIQVDLSCYACGNIFCVKVTLQSVLNSEPVLLK